MIPGSKELFELDKEQVSIFITKYLGQEIWNRMGELPEYAQGVIGYVATFYSNPMRSVGMEGSHPIKSGQESFFNEVVQSLNDIPIKSEGGHNFEMYKATIEGDNLVLSIVDVGKE